MRETVRFHFDPLCPWAWQSSKWIREVAEVRDVEVEWCLFSLQLINAKEGEEDPLADRHKKGTPALRTLVLVQRDAGSEGVGRVYEAIGNRIHEGDEELDPDVVKNALGDAGFDPSLVDAALEDGSTMDEVRRQHDEIVETVGAFGVPTLVFASGKAIFGPVVSSPPGGEFSGELFDHVKALAETDTFFELKRERDRRPGE